MIYCEDFYLVQILYIFEQYKEAPISAVKLNKCMKASGIPALRSGISFFYTYKRMVPDIKPPRK